MHIQAEASLRSCNTLGLAAQCKAMVQIGDVGQLREALAWAKGNTLAVTVLGQGSNVVLANDLDQLILLQRSKGIEILSDDGDQLTLRVAAGENWHQLVNWALNQGYHGLENLALIPGTVGAAPIQNIGAYGVELEPYVSAVHALRISDAEALTLSAGQCQFAYRDSVFKHGLRDQLVITAVDLNLSRTAPVQRSYPALAAVLSDGEVREPSHADVFAAVVGIRQSKLPDPAVEPNAGSFFKNPILPSTQIAALGASFPELPVYPQGHDYSKVPAAWLIEHCGWKGHRENGVGVHPQHALVLVNYGANSGAELLQLAGKIAVSVKSTFGIELQIEPRVYGSIDE